MKESDKKRLQINCRDLVSNIVVSDIQDYLFEKDVISSENLESLLHEKSPQKAVRYLVVSILPRKGPQAFEIFCDALRENGYEYLAEQLENTKVDRGSSNCNDNSCLHEKRQLQHKTKHLEEELNDMSYKFKNISCEEESVRMKDKETIEQLQMENFKLKKQLSFYEEPNVKVLNHKRRNGSDSNIDYGLGLKNARARETSVTGFDSGLSDMDPDDIVVDVDGAFDSLDGAISARSRTGVTPRHEISFPHGETEEKLIDVLTTDIINCMYNDEESNPKLFDIVYCKYVMALRKAVKTMSTKHEPIFRKISNQVNLNNTWREINGQMGEMYQDLLSEEFHQEALTWGKILALFTMTGFVAKRCAERKKVALPLSEFLATYIDRHLSRKIEKLGGWDTFCSHLQNEELNFTCIFPASMLQAAINNTTKSTASKNLKLQLSKTSPSKLLSKRQDTKSRNFLKTF